MGDREGPDSGRLHPYQQTIDAVIAALGTEPDRGLDDREARVRLTRDGPNELIAEPPTPAWKKLLAQFQNVLVVLLLVATAISAGLSAPEVRAHARVIRDGEIPLGFRGPTNLPPRPLVRIIDRRDGRFGGHASRCPHGDAAQGRHLGRRVARPPQYLNLVSLEPVHDVQELRFVPSGCRNVPLISRDVEPSGRRIMPHDSSCAGSD